MAQKKATVSIVKVDDVSTSVEQVVKLASGLRIEKGDIVVIKPNVKNRSPPGYGIITDPRVIEGERPGPLHAPGSTGVFRGARYVRDSCPRG